MFQFIEERFNDIVMNQLQLKHTDDFLDFEDIAKRLSCEVHFRKDMPSCYMYNKKHKLSKIFVYNQYRVNQKTQFEEFYHEITHHLLHTICTDKNELQAKICWLFFVIPKASLKYELQNRKFNVDICELADMYNVSKENMFLRLKHYIENNISYIDYTESHMSFIISNGHFLDSHLFETK